jgi:hypothetical protein
MNERAQMVDGPENSNDSLKVSGKGNENEDQKAGSVKSLPMTSEEVMKRWGITDEKLKLLVLRFNLPARFKHFDKLEPVGVMLMTSEASFQGRSLYFLPADIEKFESDHPELGRKDEQRETESSEHEEKKLRNNQRRRERCRALAKYKWKKFPDTNITEMVKDDDIIEIGCEGMKYKADTIREWIRDLCPNPKPGRPKLD